MSSITATTAASPAREATTSDVSGAGFMTWLAVIGGCLGAFLAILNIQVVGSSLADVSGALGAGIDEGNWITTSYLIAEIIIIPMSGWLTRLLSMRTYILICASTFTLFTVLCAATTDLEQMIVVRALQGCAGGGLIPLAFSMIMTSLPKRQQPIGMAIYSLSAVLAPSIGPALGGWANDAFGWQSIFLISLLPGALTVGILWISVPGAPRDWSLLGRGDWWGILTMAVGLGTLQTVLEEGNREDWFGSPHIVNLSITAAVCLAAFIVIELCRREPLLQLRILMTRNFGIGSLANMLFGFTMFGWIFTVPAYLAHVQGYSASQIGMVMLWLGPPQLLLIAFMPRLVQRFDPRLLAGIGFILYCAGTLMATGLTADFGGEQFFWPNIIRAIAQVLVMTPLSSITITSVSREDAGSAAALFNMSRNIGGAVGIALLQTFLTHRQQFHSEVLTAQVSLYAEATRDRIASLTSYFMANSGVDASVAHRQALAAIGGTIREQSYYLAFSDIILLQGIFMGVAFVMVFLLKRARS